MKRSITAALAAVTGMAHADSNIKVYGDWATMDINGYARTYTKSVGSKDIAVSVNFVASQCGDPSIQHIASYPRESDDKERSMERVESNIRLTVDKEPASTWNEAIMNVQFEGSNRTSFSLFVLVGKGTVGQLINGTTLRVKVEDLDADRFSLNGSGKAIGDAYSRCLALDADDNFFPVLEPGESDDDYFSL